MEQGGAVIEGKANFVNRINEFDVEPGTWRHLGTGLIQVVTEIITHEFQGGEMKELEDPWVAYRDLQFGRKHITYSMRLSEFKEKFSRA